MPSKPDFYGEERQTYQKYSDEVWKKECPPAIYPYDIVKPPDIPNTHRGADACEDESPSR